MSLAKGLEEIRGKDADLICATERTTTVCTSRAETAYKKVR